MYGGYFNTLPNYDCIHNTNQGQVKGNVPDGNGIKIGDVFRVADDFEVAAGKQMSVKQITIDVLSTTAVNNAVINIRGNSSGNPGAVVRTVTMAPSSSSLSYTTAFGFNVYHLTFNITGWADLSSGTYWLEPTMSNTGGGTVYWRMTTSSYGALARNSGNSGSTWTANANSYNTVFFVAGDCIDAVVCNEPTNLNVDTITHNSARFTWTAASPAPANGYDYYYNETGIPPVGGPSGSVGAGITTRTQTGLASNRQYHFWIRSKCSPTVTSNWVYGGYFTTLPNSTGCFQGDGQIRGNLEDGYSFNSAVGMSVADDFVVNTGDLLTVSQVSLEVVTDNGKPTSKNFTIKVRQDTPSGPGAVLDVLWNNLAPSYVSDAYTIDSGFGVYHVVFNLPVTPTYPAGVYWLEASMNNSASNYAFWRTTYSGAGGVNYAIQSDDGWVTWDLPDYMDAMFWVAGTCSAASNCSPVTATASKYSVCAGETVTLTASSSTPGYTYSWYTGYNGTPMNGGTLIGTGSSINVNPTVNTSYGVVATKAGCPSGVLANYDLISIAITPPPSLIAMSPIESVACSDESREIKVISGGIIPTTILNETFNPVTNSWTTQAIPEKMWYIYNDGDLGLHSPDNSNFVLAMSDGTPGGLSDSYLTSQPLSFLDYNSGTTNITLTFNHYYRHWLYDTGYVQISTDDNTWTTLATYNTTQGTATSWNSVSLNLNAYKGQPYVKIRFKYTSNNDWYWAVDNIKITGTNPLPTTVTWKVKNSSPASYAGLYKDAAKTLPYNGENMSTVYASPASTTVYTISAKTSVGCPAETEVTVERGDKNWLNTGNTSWTNVSNWNEGGIPTADHCVKIPNMPQNSWPIVPSGVNGVAKNVTIESGGGLTIKTGGSLTVTDFVDNQSTADGNFVIESDANLIQNNDVANTGLVKVEKAFTFSSERKQYNFVSVPVRDVDPVGAPTYLKTTIYTPNPTSVQQYNTASYYFDEVNGRYISAKGYAVKEPASGNEKGVFVGIPFNGPLSYTLSTAGGKYNLTGNPYPSNIDLVKLYNDAKNGGANKSNIESTFYFWDNRGNAQFTQQGSGYGSDGLDQYAPFNAVAGTGSAAPAYSNGNSESGRAPDQYAKVGTGFMVQAKGSGSPVLNFNNDYRTKDGSVSFFGKTTEDAAVDRYWLTMTAPIGISVMNAVVYFEGGNDAFAEDDTESFDPSDDAYTIVEGKHCVIQGKRPFTNTDQIPMGYRAFAPGYRYISVYQKEGIFESEQDIYLIDKLLNLTWNISKEPYRFLSKSGEFNDRFLIVYKPQLTATAPFAKNEIEMVKQNDNIVITSSIDKISAVEIYDLNSRPVYKKSAVNTNQFRVDALKFNHQIIIVRIKTETGEVVSKKFVNN